MACNAENKSYTIVCQEKNFYHGWFFGKNFYPNQITHDPLKSQMVGP